MNNDFFNLVNFWHAIRIYGWWQVAIELLIIGMFVTPSCASSAAPAAST